MKKVGEGVFGEVFVCCASNSVLKIIPVDGSVFINDSPQKPILEVIGEYRISKELERAKLEGFVQCKKATLCNGKYPKVLENAWTAFDEAKEFLVDKYSVRPTSNA